jgi:hypothetical protein
MQVSSRSDTRASELRRLSNAPQRFPPSSSGSSTYCPAAWHEAWWATKSNQTLALTLLAASARADPTFSWLPLSEVLGANAIGLFEVELAEHVLNEQPRQTQLDLLALGKGGVIAVRGEVH